MENIFPWKKIPSIDIDHKDARSEPGYFVECVMKSLAGYVPVGGEVKFIINNIYHDRKIGDEYYASPESNTVEFTAIQTFE